LSKKKHHARTNAMRLLDINAIDYRVLSFSPNIHSAERVAEALGLDSSKVYKTLVIQRSQGKPLLVMVPGNEQVDLNMLAVSVGEKKLRMATRQNAEGLTGLQIGGISALALLNKGFEICIDATARELTEIVISAGKRGLDLCLSVADLVYITGARWVVATSR
jgi:Cys-tRNA(Pro)/Cys-tRNA(Cys) deacylase